MVNFLLIAGFLAFVAWVIYDVKSKPKKPKPQSTAVVDELTAPIAPAPRKQGFVVTVNGIEHDFSNDALYLEIAPLIAREDWDSARRYLQKVTYGVINGSEFEKETFKIFMMGFASADPLYAHCVRSIQPILQEHPDGIRQTALYPHMAAAPDTETARYVLYYADLLGAIRRTKKGNSYTVFASR